MSISSVNVSFLSSLEKSLCLKNAEFQKLYDQWDRIIYLRGILVLDKTSLAKLFDLTECDKFIKFEVNDDFKRLYADFQCKPVLIKGYLVEKQLKNNRTNETFNKVCLENAVVCGNLCQIISLREKGKFLSPIEIKTLEIFHKREAYSATYDDIDLVLTRLLLKRKKPNICIIWPKKTKVRGDFFDQLGVEESSYKLHHKYVDFYASQIAEVLKECCNNQVYDLVAIVRGGGDSLFHLNNNDVLEIIVESTIPVLMAAGHQEDTFLAKFIATKTLVTPTAFGNYLNGIATNAKLKIGKQTHPNKNYPGDNTDLYEQRNYHHATDVDTKRSGIYVRPNGKVDQLYIWKANTFEL